MSRMTRTLLALVLLAGVTPAPSLRAEDPHAKLREEPAPGPPPPEPSGYRMDDYRKPVPLTLAGAKVVDTLQVEKLQEGKAAIFIDVFPKPPKPVNLPAGTLWIDPKHDTIAGSHWVPNVGYGVMPTGVDEYFRATLTRLTTAQPGKPLLFFCLRNCWMSWNAAKRAIEWGYKDVIWYPEGTDGWLEAGNDLFATASEP
jgi:PQQ-dependent catabolism-associated CXXCW motif protein